MGESIKNYCQRTEEYLFKILGRWKRLGEIALNLQGNVKHCLRVTARCYETTLEDQNNFETFRVFVITFMSSYIGILPILTSRARRLYFHETP